MSINEALIYQIRTESGNKKHDFRSKVRTGSKKMKRNFKSNQTQLRTKVQPARQVFILQDVMNIRRISSTMERIIDYYFIICLLFFVCSVFSGTKSIE